MPKEHAALAASLTVGYLSPINGTLIKNSAHRDRQLNKNQITAKKTTGINDTKLVRIQTT